jgi:ATP-dependent Clp protease, protease subunit
MGWVSMTSPERPDRPEIPYPFPPYEEPPRRTDPVLVPTVDMPVGDASHRLFDRRTVMVTGPLDHDAASRLCAGLMALDGESGADVKVVLNSPGGPLAEVSAVLDVIDLMRARVQTTCVGTAKGSAGIVLACGTGQRRAAPNATISLRCERPGGAQGTAEDLARAAAEADELMRRIRDALVAATGQSADSITAEIDHGGVHGAAEARALGIIDEVGRPKR